MAKAKQKQNKYLVHTFKCTYVHDAREGDQDLEDFKDKMREHGAISDHEVEIVEADSEGDALDKVCPPMESL